MGKIVYEMFWYKGPFSAKTGQYVVPGCVVRKGEQLRIVIEKADKRKKGLVDNRPMEERIFGR